MSPNVTQAPSAIINQEPITRRCHEIRIAVNIVRAIHPRQHLVEESLDLRIRAARLELRDPNRTASGDLARVLDVFLEIGGVGGVVVPESLAPG